jgi:hypothetical protein
VVRSAEEQKDFLSRFVVLNEQGAEIDETQRRNVQGLGVLVSFSSKGEASQCTVAHTSAEKAVTAAHCVSEKLNENSLALFYFSEKIERFVLAHVNKVSHRGSESRDDILSLELDARLARDWSTYTYHKDPNLSNGVEESMLLTFDPLFEHPDLQAQFPGQAGAVFSPKRNCFASHQIPFVADANNNVFRPKKFSEVTQNKKLDPAIHWFVDQCTISPRKGDSGGLLVSSATRRPLGVLHWIIEKSQFNANEIYFGNDQKWKPILDRGSSPSEALMAVATSL